MKETRPFWEASYQSGDETAAFGHPSTEVVALAGKLQSGARVLDLGCGEGRHAIYLARRGFEVTAIDISKAAIRKLSRLADEAGIRVRALHTDMREYAFVELFDLIVAHGSLHLIARNAWTKVIGEMKAHTRHGGHNIVAVFTDKLPSPDDLEPFHVGLFREGELYDHYRDWDIIETWSYILEDEHPGNIHHRHPVNKLVARRPG
jgi:tellurite methyltransferase